MRDRAPQQIPHSRAPRAGEEPREADEREREVGRGDRDDAEERYLGGWVPPGPDVDGDEGERGGEEGHVYEGGEELEGVGEG